MTEEVRWATSLEREAYCIFRASWESNKQTIIRFFQYLFPYSNMTDFIDGNWKTYIAKSHNMMTDRLPCVQVDTCTLSEYYEENRTRSLNIVSNFLVEDEKVKE